MHTGRPRASAHGLRQSVTVIVKLLVVLAAGYAVLAGYVYLNQHRMVFLPDAAGAGLEATPATLGLEHESVEFTTADGVRLHGWFVPASGPTTLLFFHGNAGNISHRLTSLQFFHELGLSVFIIDYRGYGESEGRPTEQGTYADAEAAWNYLTGRRGIAPGDIVVFGRSLGGSIAAWLASRHTPRGLIVESAFTSLPALGRQIYWFLPVRWLSRFEYPTREYIADVQCPVLIVHSRDDEVVPFEHGRALYSAANEPRTLLELSGGHNEAYLRIEHGAYREGLERFLGRLD